MSYSYVCRGRCVRVRHASPRPGHLRPYTKASHHEERFISHSLLTLLCLHSFCSPAMRFVSHISALSLLALGVTCRLSFNPDPPTSSLPARAAVHPAAVQREAPPTLSNAERLKRGMAPLRPKRLYCTFVRLGLHPGFQADVHRVCASSQSYGKGNRPESRCDDVSRLKVTRSLTYTCKGIKELSQRQARMARLDTFRPPRTISAK